MSFVSQKKALKLVAEQLDIVKYGEPILVEVLNKNEVPERTLKIGTKRSLEKGFPLKPVIPGLVRINNGDRDVFYTFEDLRTILNIMFPSKSFKSDGKLWRKEICMNQATRADLFSLEEELPAKMNLLNVNTIGISNMEAYMNFLYLDELIREETLNCPERGLLLQRIRREFQLFFDLYEELIRNANRFFHHQSLYAVALIKETKKELQLMLEEKTQLERQLDLLEIELAHTKRLAQTRIESDLKVYEDEMLCIKRSNQQFEMMLQLCAPGHKVLASVRTIFLDLSRI